MVIESALVHVRQNGGGDLLRDSQLSQLVASLGIQFRERLLTPMVLLRLFLIQILHGNTAINHLRQISGIGFAASSYCEARLKLPLRLFCRVLQWTVDAARSAGAQRMIGARVIVMDCTSASMPDTPQLRKRFGLPRGRSCKEGVSYPILKLATLIDLASGCILRMITTPLYVHEASGVLRLSRFVRSGDIVLGDRAFCSYVHLALLWMRGTFACMRLHQRRKLKGTRIECWKRPVSAPKWIAQAFYLTLPPFIDVRIVSYRIRRRGFRTHQVTIATTLLDESLWPDAKIAELYNHRWEIETCFNHLKTTMGMCVLKCQSWDGVRRELLMYQIAYNLVRLLMLQHAMGRGIEVNRVSLIDAIRLLIQRLQGLPGVALLIINPERPGRYHPRVIRRRMKEYDLLTEPRAARIARELQEENA
jgi:hypothetical protein